MNNLTNMLRTFTIRVLPPLVAIAVLIASFQAEAQVEETFEPTGTSSVATNLVASSLQRKVQVDYADSQLLDIAWEARGQTETGLCVPTAEKIRDRIKGSKIYLAHRPGNRTTHVFTCIDGRCVDNGVMTKRHTRVFSISNLPLNYRLLGEWKCPTGVSKCKVGLFGRVYNAVRTRAEHAAMLARLNSN